MRNADNALRLKGFELYEQLDRRYSVKQQCQLQSTSCCWMKRYNRPADCSVLIKLALPRTSTWSGAFVRMSNRHDAQPCSSPQKRTYRKTTALEDKD